MDKELREVRSTIDFYLESLAKDSEDPGKEPFAGFYERRVISLLNKEKDLQRRLGKNNPRSSVAITNAFDGIFQAQAFEEKCITLVPDFETINRELLAHFAKHPFEMGRLHWRRFEELLAEIFKGLGYETTLGPGRRDGGVDIWAVQKSTIGEMLLLIQAKKYDAHRRISLEPVSALYGVLEAQKANQAVLATTSQFEPSARKFAAQLSNRIILATPEDIRVWIQEVLGRPH